MTETKRKGAKSMKEVPEDVLKQLNNGQIETANLVEWLAVDKKCLLENVLTQFDRKQYLTAVLCRIENLKKQTVNTINEAIGAGLFEQATANDDRDFLSKMARHSSDTVRCWACYAVGRNKTLTVRQMLEQIQPFAADRHFVVRDISWMAIRKTIIENLNEVIEILSEWTQYEDENLRRFASEATRPRGVWCEHIEALKQNPEPALSILEPLKSDSAKYVRDSAGNWLNDASKTCPDFVKQICERWKIESKTKETEYIIKKALRTIEKIKYSEK